MVWRQGQSYSEDLRARVLAAVDGGLAARAAAQLFRVSVSYIYKALIRLRRTGQVSAGSRRSSTAQTDAGARGRPGGASSQTIRISPWRRCKLGWPERWGNLVSGRPSGVI